MACRRHFCWRSPNGHSCSCILCWWSCGVALRRAKKDRSMITVRSVPGVIWIYSNTSVSFIVECLASRLLRVSRQSICLGPMAPIDSHGYLKHDHRSPLGHQKPNPNGQALTLQFSDHPWDLKAGRCLWYGMTFRHPTVVHSLGRKSHQKGAWWCDDSQRCHSRDGAWFSGRMKNHSWPKKKKTCRNHHHG